MRHASRAFAGAFALAVLPAALVAQPVLGSNVAFSSAYVWRGVTNTNRPVVQPDLTLTIPVRGGSLTFGGWASIEPARYDGDSDISAVYGMLPGPAFTQYAAWVEHAFSMSGAEFTAGATAYTYPSVADLAAQFNTVEFYGSMTMPLRFSPRIAAWYDVAAVRGAYVEAALSHDMSLLSVPVSLEGLVGVSAGQGPDPTGHQAYFARDGVTHAELSVTGDIVLGRLSIGPTVHIIRAFDSLARMTSPVSSRAMKLWLGATLSWTSDAGSGP